MNACRLLALHGTPAVVFPLCSLPSLCLHVGLCVSVAWVSLSLSFSSLVPRFTSTPALQSSSAHLPACLQSQTSPDIAASVIVVVWCSSHSTEYIVLFYSVLSCCLRHPASPLWSRITSPTCPPSTSTGVSQLHHAILFSPSPHLPRLSFMPCQACLQPLSILGLPCPVFSTSPLSISNTLPSQ